VNLEVETNDDGNSTKVVLKAKLMERGRHLRLGM